MFPREGEVETVFGIVIIVVITGSLPCRVVVFLLDGTIGAAAVVAIRPGMHARIGARARAGTEGEG